MVQVEYVKFGRRFEIAQNAVCFHLLYYALDLQSNKRNGNQRRKVMQRSEIL